MNDNSTVSVGDLRAILETRIAAFAAVLEADTIRGLHERGVGCQANIDNSKTSVKYGGKYARVDIGGSGRYMVELSTGNIYGIKAYGVIHRGHLYGTVDTVNRWDWSRYYATPK
jgi:hypothetical protein